MQVPPFSKHEFALSGGVSFNILTLSDHCHAEIMFIAYTVICFINEVALLVKIGYFKLIFHKL